MQESQQRLLDEQLQLSLDTNKTGLSISSHDSQIDLLEQYTKVCYFRILKNGMEGSFLQFLDRLKNFIISEIQFIIFWIGRRTR